MTTLEVNSYMYERHATPLNGGLHKKNLCHHGHSRYWPKGAPCHNFATIHVIMHGGPPCTHSHMQSKSFLKETYLLSFVQK